jgi:hypothetical protein
MHCSNLQNDTGEDLFAYLTKLSTIQTNIASDDRMINELEKMWKWSWHNLRNYPDICLEGLTKHIKPYVKIAGIRVEI